MHSATGPASGALPDGDVNTEEPTVEEIRAAIVKLKNGRAAGLDGIAPELFRHAADPISHGLHSLFAKIWRSGRVPADWRDGFIIPLYKGKESKADCSS